MTKRTRDEWLESGGRPRRNAQQHMDAWTHRHALRILGPDPTPHSLQEFVRAHGPTVKALAGALGAPYHRIWYRIHRSEAA